MESERRFGKREPVEMRAQILGETGRPIDVVVRDYSHHGCRLEFNGHTQTPRQFTLKYVDSGLPDARVEVAWQRGADMGVRFLLADDKRSSKPVESDAKKLSVSELRAIVRRTGQ